MKIKNELESQDAGRTSKKLSVVDKTDTVKVRKKSKSLKYIDEVEVLKQEINDEITGVTETSDKRKSKTPKVFQPLGALFTNKNSRSSKPANKLENLDTPKNESIKVLYTDIKENSVENPATSNELLENEKRKTKGHVKNSKRFSKKTDLSNISKAEDNSQLPNNECNIEIKLDKVISIENYVNEVKPDKTKRKRSTLEIKSPSETDNIKRDSSDKKIKKKSSFFKSIKFSKSKPEKSVSKTLDAQDNLNDDLKVQDEAEKRKASNSEVSQASSYKLLSGLKNYEVEERLKTYKYKFNHEDSLSNFANK